MKKLIVVALLVAFFCSNALGAGVNLSALGAGHAHSDGAAVWARAWILVPNAPWNWCYAGVGTAAWSPVGIAFGGGDGLAWNVGGFVIVLRARARAAVLRTGPGGPLHAWGLGHADPTPQPCLDPFNNSPLNAIFNDVDTIPIPDVESWTEQAFEDSLDAYLIGPGNPGSDGFARVEAELFEDSDEIVFSFTADSCRLKVHKEQLCKYSIGLCIHSDDLDINRYFSLDQTGKRSFQGGWSESSVELTEGGDTLVIGGLQGLDFTVAVPPDFTADDFQNSDLVMQVVVTAAIAETCVPSLTEWGMIVLAIMLLLSGLWVYRNKKKAHVTVR